MGATWIERWSSRKSLENDPDVKDFHAGDSLLYNSMIAPLVPYALRGMIWYQGETNVGNPTGNYKAFLSAMIRDRRADFGKAFGYELPVGIVQIAPFRYADKDPGCCPGLWEEQLRNPPGVPNTGLVVTTDLSDVKEIHPQRKQEVGDRLALWALAKVYGQGNLVYSGPLYRAMKIDGRTIRLEFDHVGSGLVASDGKPLTHFTMAGEDQVFHPAEAEIKGSSIVVSSESVPVPWRSVSVGAMTPSRTWSTRKGCRPCPSAPIAGGASPIRLRCRISFPITWCCSAGCGFPSGAGLDRAGRWS